MRFLTPSCRAVLATALISSTLAVSGSALAAPAPDSEVEADDEAESETAAPGDDVEPDAPAEPVVPAEDDDPSLDVPPTTEPSSGAPTDAPQLAAATRLEPVNDVRLDPSEIVRSPTPTLNSAVISEIHYNPNAVYDSRGEWFEVHNTGRRPVNMAGWTFGDEIYDIHTIATDLIVPGGESAVLARFGEPARNGGVDTDYVYGDSVLLYNVGDQLILRDSSGRLVDEVDYSADGFEVANGRSISLADLTADNSVGSNWCLSTTPMPAGDMGSPGRDNECGESAATLAITEVLNNPAASSDFSGEWFEVHNYGAASIDLDGFTVQDDDSESFTIDQSVVVDPGGYVVVGVTADLVLNGGVDVDYAYGTQMRLHNTFDEIVLVDPAGIQVDAVRWDDGRTFPDPNGASMTLPDVNVAGVDNGDGANWCTSTLRWNAQDFGSPGIAGTCDAVQLPDVMFTEIMFDPERTASERNGEWFEITNVGADTAVLDGYELRTYSTQHIITELSIEPGERAVLASNGTPTSNGGIVADYVYGSDLPLYNTISTLELLAPDAQVVDRVKWSDPLGFPNEKGHSIELRDTDANNLLGANWCPTIERFGDGDFGTPGAAGTCTPAPPALPLMISEVMRNPATVSDTVGEWFELFNPTSDPVSLRNWSISDEGSEFHVIGADVVVPANGYAVIGRSSDTTINGGAAVDYGTGSAIVLFNSVDELIISDQYGQLVDQVAWDRSSVTPRPNGGSMARMTSSMLALASSDDESAWCAPSVQYGAGDRGTPGTENICDDAPNRAIVINEIHRDPKALPDAQGEWLELHNTGDVDIDISGWTLRDDDVDEFVFDPNQPVIIEAGGYLVAGRNTENLNGGIEIDVQYGVEFIHYNTTDEVMLLDDQLAVVDRVAWNAGNGFPKVSGATMSLRSTTADNAVGANWCAAVTDQGNGDFGTPGAANVCELPVDPHPTLPTTPTHSLFATGDSSCGGDIVIRGSAIYVGGAVRANDDIVAQGSGVIFNGPISHGGNNGLGWGAITLGGRTQDAAPQQPTFGWQLSDFAPGGVRALAAGDAYTVHQGGWQINDKAANIPAGIHYVDGDVAINSKTALLNSVTIVATGSITVNSKSIAVSPYASDLPALMSGAQSCSDAGVTLSGSSVTITGAVFAPDATVVVRSALISVRQGTIVGSSLTFEGSGVVVNLFSGFVRVTAMCKGTGDNDGMYQFRVRHEGSTTGSFPYELRVGSEVLHSGSIDAGETQYVWLPDSTKGVKAIATGSWFNDYTGTASSNGKRC